MLRFRNFASVRSVELATGGLDRDAAVEASGECTARIHRARQAPARLMHRDVVDIVAVPQELSARRDRGSR